MPRYHLRLTPLIQSHDDPVVNPTTINNYFSKYELYFAVEEYGEKEGGLHYHVNFTHSRKQQTVRDAILAAFEGIGGNTGRYTLKYQEYTEGDTIAPYRYLCKGATYGELPKVVGGTPPIGYTIEQLHEAYWDINKDLKKKAKAAKESGKVLEIAYVYFQTYQWPNQFEEAVEDVWRYFTDRCIGDAKGTNDFLISSYVTTIINKFFPERKQQYIKTQARKTIEKYGNYW